MHLEAVGFEASPRFLGLDERGRATLSFVEGEVFSDCRSMIWEDRQLEAAARLLRRFHDATAGTDLAAPAEVACHNDFGPWNLIWLEQMPVAIIDFDNAAPGARLDDLGYAVWKHLNLGLIDLPVSEQRRRLRLMAAAYRFTSEADDLVGGIERALERMERTIEAAPASTRRSEALAQHRRKREWLREHVKLLIG